MVSTELVIVFTNMPILGWHYTIMIHFYHLQKAIEKHSGEETVYPYWVPEFTLVFSWVRVARSV